MKQCWICNNYYPGLSEEHIIPKLFGGAMTTKEFSCEDCNHAMGKHEAKLSPISIFMQYHDNAEGDPATAIPQKGSPRNKKWTYGESPKIELSTTGSMKSSDGWERQPGKITSNHKLWIPASMPLNVDNRALDMSMVKAIAALLCREGWPKHLLEIPLAFLAGDDKALQDMRPTLIGLANPSMFACIWVISPPARGPQTIYGAVIYGPIAHIYTLCTLPLLLRVPFCLELKAYARQTQCNKGIDDYNKWHATVCREFFLQESEIHLGQSGPYAARQSVANGLITLEVSPAWARRNQDLLVPMNPLEATHGWENRFGNWLMSLRSEETHAQFLADTRTLEATYASAADGQSLAVNMD